MERTGRELACAHPAHQAMNVFTSLPRGQLPSAKVVELVLWL